MPRVLAAEYEDSVYSQEQHLLHRGNKKSSFNNSSDSDMNPDCKNVLIAAGQTFQ